MVEYIFPREVLHRQLVVDDLIIDLSRMRSKYSINFDIEMHSVKEDEEGILVATSKYICISIWIRKSIAYR